MENLVSFVAKSGNRKTGAIPVTFSHSDTCPDSCPLKAGGCYAKYSFTGLHWKNVDKNGRSWNELCSNISKLPDGQIWRFNVAGDLPGKNDIVSTRELKKLVRANQGKKGFTYSHKPVLKKQSKHAAKNLNAIRHANANGFTINFSANNLKHADELKKLGAGPVVTILPRDVTEKTLITPEGNKVIVCPATYRDEVTCASCGLCQHAKRSVIVGFPAHGTGAKQTTAISQR